MKAARALRRGLAYGWAAPNTLLGLLLGLVVLLLGGRVQRRAGVAEFHGGRLARWVRRWHWPFGALTLGHVVLGLDAPTLAALRRHEQAHVRQYERWGPLFLPAYGLAGLWARARGGEAHHDNPFERQARAAERAGPKPGAHQGH